MGLSKARVLAIEKSEAAGALNLDTIHRAAEALDCTLVYVLIPRKPLDQTVRERALEVAAEHLSAVDHTMRLEDQGVSGQTAQRQLGPAPRTWNWPTARIQAARHTPLS